VGAINTVGIQKFRDFSTNRYISQTIQDSAVVTMEGEWKTGACFEWYHFQ